jgi:aspartate racemase
MVESIVGVLGGMGPEATVELMRRVLAATPVTDDADHIHMIVDNNPKVPSRIKALLEGGGDNPGPVLARMAQRLECAGADFLVIPCNTAHYYWPYAAQAVSIPVWHLVDLTLRLIAETTTGNKQTIGLLASPALRKIALYEPWCAQHGLTLVYPQQEQALLTVIKAVKRGQCTARELAQFNNIAQSLVGSGVDALVLGCTEFSLIAPHLEVEIPVFDTLQVLAEQIVTEVKGIAARQDESK